MYFGTGNTQKLQSQSSQVKNRLYGIKDKNFPNFVTVNPTGNVSMCKTAPVCPRDTDLGWYVELKNSKKLTAEPTVDKDNDKNTVIALREIAVEKVKVPDLEESAVYKLRKHVEQVDDTSEEDENVGDDFENLYKGEISKSGTPILPSKRARRIPERIQVSKEDLEELKGSSEPEISTDTEESDNEDVSLENLKEEEAKENPDIKEDTEATNS